MVGQKYFTLLVVSFVLTLTFSAQSFATNYYVDKDAAGSNSGTSWQNAWESFADINWDIIGADDIIYISGGNTSKVYNDLFNFPEGLSGTSGNPVTITAGIDPGHNGVPILDGINFPNEPGIYIDNSSYVTISNLNLKHWLSSPGNNGTIGIHSANNIIIENNTILAWSQGVKVSSSYNCTIRNNIITTADNLETQTDGIYASQNTDNIYEGNYINISNAGTNHNDCFQGHQEGPCIIRNNYMIHTGGSALKPVDSQGIFDKEGHGLHQYIGNFIYLPNRNRDGIQMNDFVLGQKRPTSGSASAYVLNNTVVGASTHTLSISTDNPIIKNNLIVMLDDTAETRYDGSIDESLIDNNLYWKIDPVTGVRNDVVLGYSTFESWQSSGGDLNGYNVDPLLDPEYKTTQQSPAIDVGANLINMGVLIDILGVVRPQGSAFDIGAYEILSGPDIYPPEVIGAVLLDSVTLKISFSEPLEPSSAQNPSNYSITNGITIFSATISGSQVTLNTAAHSTGSYTVTVNNVVDLAGNLISPENNSAEYDMIILPGPGFPVDLYDTPESEKTAYYYLTIPGNAPEFITYHLTVYDADHGGSDPPEGQAFINGNGPIDLFPGATQENGDGETNEFDLIVPKFWWVNGVNELRFVRLYSTGYRVNSASVLFEVVSDTQDEDGYPGDFTLKQNFPNPFNPSTKIQYLLPTESFVQLKVYDVLGNEVAILVNQKQLPGISTVTFNASDLPSGMYFARLTSDNKTKIIKMTLIK